jgi:hypothetical protein
LALHMGEHLFDELARALAQPLSRRRVLRLVGGALVAGMLPVARAGRAAAAPGDTGAGPPEASREPAVTDPNGPFGEPIPCGETSFGPRICDPTSNCVVCCYGSDGVPVSCCPCYVQCRSSGLCGEPFACPPDGRPYCGAQGNCCALNETCFKGSICVPVCEQGETLCEGTCCPRSHECITLKLPGQAGKRLCYPKCPRGRVRCGIGCCPPRQKCINPGRLTCSPCDVGRQPCGKKCCPQGSTCCDPGTGLCCKRRTETCAGFGGKAKCCPKGTKACLKDPDTGKPLCCKKGEVCAQVGDPSGTVPRALNGTYTCCPPERVVDFGGAEVCCPQGYTSLGGRFVLPAYGGGGFCCRNDKVCGSTCCGTNADAGLDATCCNGTCVSLYFDAANCGGCGRVCPPGQRCSAGTCVPA